MSRAVGLIANISRASTLACAREVVDWLLGRDVNVRLQAATAERLGLPHLAADDAGLATTDFIVAVGGDGTLLAASRVASSSLTSPPILGIHCGGPGSFGFLMETVPARAPEVLAAALRGEYRIDERMMVAAEVIREAEGVARFAALNDVVVAKGALARMLKMRVFVGDTFIATYAADGIIIATPTGSTGYSLASNGPLVHPTVSVIILTPICPHTLNVRPLIIGAEEQARIVIEGDARSAALLTVDGQVGFDLLPGDTVLCRRAEIAARLMVFDGNNFYQKLQTRLRLGERFGADMTDVSTTFDP